MSSSSTMTEAHYSFVLNPLWRRLPSWILKILNATLWQSTVFWVIHQSHFLKQKTNRTRMWANAQRDGRPAEYRWRPLFNAAMFGWRPILECSAVTLTRRETRWNLQGCPKLTKWSQPLVCRCSPYSKEIWRRHCCLTSFLPIVDTCLICEDIARRSCGMVPRWRFLVSFMRPVFSASRVLHIWDMHSKFPLRLHHMSKYGRHPTCDRSD